ncbi:MAG: HAMP domain-containing protein [Chloroflexi bacterium]|nr:HAMP domain-containing protein [Chloroflexota bacterium]
MTLRKKALLIIGLLQAAIIVALLLGARALLLGNYARLEEREARQDVQRALNALNDDVATLSATAANFAADDELFAYMQVASPLDIVPQRIFVAPAFAAGQFNLAVLLNAAGRSIFTKAVDLETRQETKPLTRTLNLLIANPVLLQLPKTDGGVSGLLVLPDGPVMVASRPVLTGRFSGPPRGTLILARDVNEAAIKRLNDVTRLSFTLQRIKPDAPAAARDDGGVLVRVVDADRLVGAAAIKDIGGQAALALQVNLKRELFKQGQADVLLLTIVLALSGLVLAAAVLAILERLVLSPVAHLSADVAQIGAAGDFSARVRVKSRDEIGRLSGAVNTMLASLAGLKQQVDAEHARAENLLINILPKPIAERLKRDSRTIADSYAEATVLFSDIVGFTALSAGRPPEETVQLLNEVFSAFDELARKHRLEKIKTIGDSYMVVGGLPEERADHVEAVADLALEMHAELARLNAVKGQDLRVRTGMNTGPVVAGVIGTHKFIYDLWGDTVNTASRMESHSVADCIQVTEAVYDRLKDKYVMDDRGIIDVKSKGPMHTYWLRGRKDNGQTDLSADG